MSLIVSFRQRRWIVAACSVLAFGVASFGGGLAAIAQDQPAGPNTTRAFAEVLREWKAIDADLDRLTNAYSEATEVELRRTLLAEYRQKIAISEQTLAELRSSALAEYRQTPNKDADVTRVLLGVLDDSLRRDRYDEAAEVATLLLDNDCPEPALPDMAGRVAYCRDEFAKAESLLKQAQEANKLSSEGERLLEDVATAKTSWAREQQIREKEATANDLPRVALETTKGRIVIELFENEAPETIGNFVSLVEKRFYDGLAFHRVLPGFMAQGGDPAGNGSGGPGYEIYCECEKPNHREHFRGTLSMAHAGKDTGGSQFFLTFRRTPHLDGRHTVFGRVIEGLDVLAKLQRRNPQFNRGLPEPDRIVKAEVLRKRDHAYAPRKVGAK
ncbi:MAG: peptidylprolyl isomerase [Planctomycetales bacterium]|nr:peptidylprolyl isomerase [Planctomycetales bacterium]